MIEAIDVYDFIKENDGVDDSENSKLLSACHKAALWLEKSLRSDADPNGKSAFYVAAAMARFNLFCENMREMKSFKAGDISVSNNPSAEYEAEKKLLENTLVQFCDILKDGGFYFETT